MAVSVLGTAVFTVIHSESSGPAALKGIIRLNVASEIFYRFLPSYRHFLSECNLNWPRSLPRGK